jgi:uncharacterized membrane protein
VTPPVIRAPGALTPPLRHGVRAAVGKVLHAGVLTSAAILLAGYVVDLLRDPAEFSSHAIEQAHLTAKASFPHSFPALFSALGHGSGDAIIVAGVLALILTPVAGLAVGAVAFARRGDWLFTAISATVLTIILGSFVLGTLAA